MILIILISILFFIFIEIIYYYNTFTKETFTNTYDFEQYLQSNQSNSNKLISRIRKIDNIYKRNGINNNTQKINILVQDFKYFIDNELSNINNNTILNIIDHPFKSICSSIFNYNNFLDNKKIKKVYCENWNDKPSPKLIITPIGFGSTYLQTNEKDLIKIAKSQKKIENKPLKILSNAHLNIHINPKSGSYNQRIEMYNQLKNNKLIDFWIKPKERTQTWKLHDNYSFELCPEGNGLDTHRFYEALYLNTIPIIKKNTLKSMHCQYPCVIIDDWNEITEQNCIQWKKELQYRIENEKYKLYTDYWNKIT